MPMTHMPPDRCTALTSGELEELNALREAITLHPASVHSDRMERFADLMVRCLDTEDIESSDK